VRISPQPTNPGTPSLKATYDSIKVDTGTD
jgi:hypothetical protein